MAYKRRVNIQKEADLELQQQAQQYQDESYEKYSSPSALVNQYQEAGLNPALMYGQAGASIGNSFSSSGGSVSGSNSPFVGDVSQLIGLASQLKLNEAQTKNIEANTQYTNSRTTGQDIQNDIESQTKDDTIRKRYWEANEAYTRVAYNNQQKKNAEQQFQNMITENKATKMGMYSTYWSAIKNKIDGQTVLAMLPYQQALSQATTEKEKAQCYMLELQALYQKECLDKGQVEYMMTALRNQAQQSETKSASDVWDLAMRQKYDEKERSANLENLGERIKLVQSENALKKVDLKYESTKQFFETLNAGLESVGTTVGVGVKAAKLAATAF